MQIEENEFPCYYIDSDKASKSAQNIYKTIIWASLILMFISTMMESIDPRITNHIPSFDKINGIIVFISASITVFLTFNTPEKKWYLGRAIAESIKTLSWRYMMQAAPFELRDEQSDIKNFTQRIDEINREANADNFIPKPNKYHLDILTKKMQEIRALSFAERKSIYASHRIENQIKWYGNKSEANRRKANVCSGVIITCQFVAAIYLFQLIDKIRIINLNNIMIFLAMSVISIVELNKYKELFQSYALTKQELNTIRSRFGVVQDDAQLNEFVLEAEQAISREHTMWLARRGGSNLT